MLTLYDFWVPQRCHFVCNIHFFAISNINPKKLLWKVLNIFSGKWGTRDLWKVINSLLPSKPSPSQIFPFCFVSLEKYLEEPSHKIKESALTPNCYQFMRNEQEISSDVYCALWQLLRTARPTPQYRQNLFWTQLWWHCHLWGVTAPLLSPLRGQSPLRLPACPPPRAAACSLKCQSCTRRNYRCWHLWDRCHCCLPRSK